MPRLVTDDLPVIDNSMVVVKPRTLAGSVPMG